MFGDTKYSRLIVLILFFSCQKVPQKNIEITFEEIYLNINDKENIAPRNRMNGKIISYSKDTLNLYLRCSSCPKKYRTHSFAYTVVDKDTIKLGSYFNSQLSIPPFDTLDYELIYMLNRHSVKKALEDRDSTFWFKYDNVFLDKLLDSEIYHRPDFRDYRDSIPIPTITFKKAPIFKIYYQNSWNYKYINNH